MYNYVTLLYMCNNIKKRWHCSKRLLLFCIWIRTKEKCLTKSFANSKKWRKASMISSLILRWKQKVSPFCQNACSCSRPDAVSDWKSENNLQRGWFEISIMQKRLTCMHFLSCITPNLGVVVGVGFGVIYDNIILL